MPDTTWTSFPLTYKTAIFEGWCDFLNYFDSSIHFQLSFLNLAASEETFANSISIPPQGDAFDSIREEYTTMLQNQLARGNNGLIKTNYLTFGIDADSIKAAKPRLERIETDILNNFKRLGVAATTLDGKERLSQGWCDFLNYFDSSIHFQLSFLNLAASEETFANSISIPPQGDAFDSIREEYTTMLQNQLARGNNGLIKTNYLTFGIDADSIKAAKPRLERIETDILNNFKRLGVAATTLDGKERLSQLHAVFHILA